jgi:hypothetical protein
MAIMNLYSKRKKLEQGGAEVYQYDDLPEKLRVQLVYILRDAIGEWDSNPMANQWWTAIHDMVAREKGLARLSKTGNDQYRACMGCVLEAATDDVLDLLEAALTYFEVVVQRRYKGLSHVFNPNAIIEELNGRFRENGVGYFYSDGRIGRVDSQYLHTEAVQPALQLLREQGKWFAGPCQEFLAAHGYHRKGKGQEKDAVANALKAFESTLKAICDGRGWVYDRNKDAAKALLDIVFAKKLIPDYLQTQFAGIRSILEGGVPTVSNRTSRHGQGATPTDVPDWLVAYVLHVTAANIVMLVEAQKAMPK